MDMPKCDCCGRFMCVEPGTGWKMIYSGYPPTPDREVYRCKRCVAEHGTFEPQHGIKPECSCGVVASHS